MKFNTILITILIALGLSATTIAQVPNYVPTNGLLGWYPFNGNANDESMLGTNGTVNSAILTNDRFGTVNQSYYFNGFNSNIDLGINPSINSISNAFSISYWIKPEVYGGTLVANYSSQGVPMSSSWRFNSKLNSSGHVRFNYVYTLNGNWQELDSNPLIIDLNNWHHCVYTRSGGSANLYINGVLISSSDDLASGNLDNPTSPPAITKFGYNFPSAGGIDYYKGIMDDIGIWNRVLTQQEVTDLFNSGCLNDLVITPENNTSQSGGSVTFTANTSDPNPSYTWQSDFGQGYQTLYNFGNYSEVNTNTLTINNLQLANHLQQIRAISSSGNCIDTSNVASITLTDTCINYITVTDTLVINTTLSNLSAPNNINTIKVYPNPASTHITIDYGDYAFMNDFNLQILNILGQTMFTTTINQQSTYIDLSTWTGDGLYFVQVIDPQGNIIDNRKIIIQ